MSLVNVNFKPKPMKCLGSKMCCSLKATPTSLRGQSFVLSYTNTLLVGVATQCSAIAVYRYVCASWLINCIQRRWASSGIRSDFPCCRYGGTFAVEGTHDIDQGVWRMYSNQCLWYCLLYVGDHCYASDLHYVASFQCIAV